MNAEKEGKQADTAKLSRDIAALKRLRELEIQEIPGSEQPRLFDTLDEAPGRQQNWGNSSQ